MERPSPGRSNRAGTWQILRKPSSGTGDEQIWIDMNVDVLPTHWSRNWLVFNVRGKSGTHEVWIAPVDGKGPPRPYLETESNEAGGRLSPDERWMGYFSNESGPKTNIYVSPFPNAQENRWPVSDRGGGSGPAWRGGWRRDNFYPDVQGRGGKMMAAPVTVKGNSLEVGTTRELFTRLSGWATLESLATVSGSFCPIRPST